VTRRLLTAAGLAFLVAIAAICAFSSYQALTPGRKADDWARAIDLARRADGVEAILPALHLREQALIALGELARTGPASAQSRAHLLAGLLQVRSAAGQPEPGQYLARAVTELQAAVRLDRSNDDAAYDLELLLARGRQAGRPIGKPRPEKKRGSPLATPGTSEPGTGY
jgi:hypothetical protein